MLTFDENWLPRELTNIDQELTRSLEPFFKQVQEKSAFEEQAQAESNLNKTFEWQLKLESGELEIPNSFNEARFFLRDQYLKSISSMFGSKSVDNPIIRSIA